MKALSKIAATLLLCRLFTMNAVAEHLIPEGLRSHPARTASGRYYLLEGESDKKKNKGQSPKLELSEEVESEILKGGKVHDIPYFEQEGATCGFYALAMVMAYWHKKDPKNQNPPADYDKPGNDKLTPLYPYALSQGQCSAKKGTTTPWHLSEVAKHYGYNTSYQFSVLGGSISKLRTEVMEKGHPTLVLVWQVDSDTGQPVRNKLSGGHWIVVEGFYEHEGTEYMIVKHGWSQGDRIWKVSDFVKAWQFESQVSLYP